MNRKILVRNLLSVILLASFLVSTLHASPAWYYGKISRIFLFSNGFVLRFDSTALDDCKHKYVYYNDSQLGTKQVDRAYSMALAAQASGRTVGVVIDKSINGPGGVCNSNGSMDTKD